MELIQQLENWQRQVAEASDDAAADMDVAKRLLKHGIEALAEIERLREQLKGLARLTQHQQARIDSLMLEHCPDEMTPEQIAEWERHQQAVPNAEITGRTLAQNEARDA